MIALVQRVASARVEVAGRIVGAIELGLLVFFCAEPDDDEVIADRLAAKVIKLRVFANDAGKLDLDVGAVGGGLLLVSQFTLAADTTAGNRPSFLGAGSPELGRRLYERVVATATASHSPVACGEFGADMQVHLVNDGPVTIPLVVRR